MNSRKIVRVNVEVIYDDGTLEELKVRTLGDAEVRDSLWKDTRLVTMYGGKELLCEKRS